MTASDVSRPGEPAGDPLRRPVLLFTATTLLVFGAIYYVYGPCSDFSRFSRPAVVSSDAPLPALAGDEAGDAAQAEPDAAFIEDLRLAYPKKGADVDPQLGASLEAVARFLKDNPGAELEIIGHTCNIGQHPDNDRLSLERADAVRDYLVARGVARRRLNTIGLGEREPIASNSSDAGRIRNRRVEFRVSQ